MYKNQSLDIALDLLQGMMSLGDIPQAVEKRWMDKQTLGIDNVQPRDHPKNEDEHQLLGKTRLKIGHSLCFTPLSFFEKHIHDHFDFDTWN